MVGGGNGIVSDIRVLVLDHFVNEVCCRVIVVAFFGWVTSAGLAGLAISMLLGCPVVFLDDIGMNPFAIIIVVNAQFSLSKKT